MDSGGRFGLRKPRGKCFEGGSFSGMGWRLGCAVVWMTRSPEIDRHLFSGSPDEIILSKYIGACCLRCREILKIS